MPITLVCQNKTCPVPGRTFMVSPSHGHRKYCSVPCAAAAKRLAGSEPHKMTEIDRARLAMAFDGEGTIMLYQYNGNYLLRVGVFNTARVLPEWCYNITGVGYLNEENRSKKGYKTMHRWYCNSIPAANVLRQIRPYFLIKGKQADIVIEYLDRYRQMTRLDNKDWQRPYYQSIRRLNDRTPSTTTCDR